MVPEHNFCLKTTAAWQTNVPQNISNANLSNIRRRRRRTLYNFPIKILLSNFKELFGNHYAATFSPQWDSATD